MSLHFPKMPWSVFAVHVLVFVFALAMVAASGPDFATVVATGALLSVWWVVLYGDEAPWREDP